MKIIVKLMAVYYGNSSQKDGINDQISSKQNKNVQEKQQFWIEYLPQFKEVITKLSTLRPKAGGHSILILINIKAHYNRCTT